MKKILALRDRPILFVAKKDNHIPTLMMFDDSLCGLRHRATISRGIFNFLINCFTFVERETREERKPESMLATDKKIWDNLRNNCRENYHQGSYPLLMSDW